MNCPWSWLQQDSTRFCEESLCAWVREPANTWSNIGFVMVGILVYRLAQKENLRLLKSIGIVSGATGLGSALYHASGSYWGGALDMSGMFLGTGVLTALNLRRWRNWGDPTIFLTIVVVTAVLVAVTALYPRDARLIYVLAMPCCLIELFLFFKKRRETDYRYYLWSWVAVAIATFLWSVDVTRTLCNPKNHFFNGHAAWHFLTAISYFLIFRFYAQFETFRKRTVGDGRP